MVGKANKSPPTSAVADWSAVVDVSAVVDRTSHTFIVFTQIYAEKSRRLVRRGGFFGLGDKFFAPACRRQVSAALRAKNFIN